jgi:hypothetical protein
LHRIELPNFDPKTFPQYYSESVTEPVRFPLRIDMPRDRRCLARLFIDRQPGSDFNRREDTLILESFADRVHRTALLKPETAPGIALQTETSDFVALLDLRPYRNQPVHVRAQLVERRQDGEAVLGSAGDMADKEIVLYLDSERPTLFPQGPSRPVYENQKFVVEVQARDEVTEVAQVQFALSTKRDPSGKNPDEVELVEPKRILRLPTGAYQLSHAFEKAGEPSLFFQATDMAGNKSEIKEVTVVVIKLPTATDSAAPPPGAQLGRIEGRATLPAGAGGSITRVTLSRGGKVYRVVNKPADGRFVFEKLPPGEYEVKAEGTVAGNFGKPMPVSVTVEPGKTADPGPVQLGR